MQKGWLRITDDFVVMPIEELAQPRVEHGAVVQGCEAKEEVGWIGDGGRVSQLDQVDKHRTQGNLFAYDAVSDLMHN